MSHDYTAGRVDGALPPPPGQTANFVNPPNHDAKIVALHIVCLTLITLFVGMRICMRAWVICQLGWDDAFCVAAWMLSVAYSAITLKIMTFGLGRHLWDVPATQVIGFGEWLFIVTLDIAVAWLMVKLAFFWSYKRVFQPSVTMRWLCYAGAFVCTALYVAQFFHNIFICIPIQKDYNPKLLGHCLPSRVGGSVTAIFNVITDLYILILPLPFVWSLHMKLGPKLRLTALFGLGLFVNAASITRLAITYHSASSKDVSWKGYRLSLWTTIELDVGLICVCALLLPTFWNRVLFSSWTRLRSKLSAAFRFHAFETDIADPEPGIKLVHVRGVSTPATKSEETVDIEMRGFF